MNENPKPGTSQPQPGTPEPPPRRRLLHRRPGGRPRTLAGTAILPALFTIGNGLAGFASIHFATKDALGDAQLWNLAAGGWLIFAAIVFDMLDGRVARLARRTSDFGGQLDSLCDVISFGVAPPMLMLRTVSLVLHGQVERTSVLAAGIAVERLVWCVAGMYVACAALRLARFNVENDPDESAHLAFSGLPSPGAAAAIASLVLLFTHLAPYEEGWRSSPWVLVAVSLTLPLATLATALLMVSRLRYPHILNQYLNSKKPFAYLVKLVLLAVAALANLFVTMAVLAVAYTLSVPVRIAWARLRRRAPSTAGKPGQAP